MILFQTSSNNAILVSQGDLKDCRAKTPSARFHSFHDFEQIEDEFKIIWNEINIDFLKDKFVQVIINIIKLYKSLI